MSSFLTALFCSLVAFTAIRCVFKLEAQTRLQSDAVIIGLLTLIYVGGVGLLGGDMIMAGLNMLGVFAATIIYYSCVGWPSSQTVADALPWLRPKYVAPDDDPNWVNYKP